LDSLVSERQFQDSVVELATRLGWAVYHTHDSRRSQCGWPDLAIIRSPRLLIRELKREGEKPTAEQAWWLDALRQCGVDAGIWWPHNWDEIERILGVGE
jgi:hypothetical protein